MTEAHKNTADVLRAARKLIENPENWDSLGSCIKGRKCALEAIIASDGDCPTPAADLLREAIGQEYIGGWNDAPQRTHAEVMAAFDRAIELAEALT